MIKKHNFPFEVKMILDENYYSSSNKMALTLWLLKILGVFRPFSLLLFESFTIVVRRGDYSHNNYL